MGEREFGMTFKAMRLRSGAPAFKRAKKSHTDHAKLMRLQRQVRALSPELKMFEGSVSPTFPVAATGSIDYLSFIGQGSDNTNRIGDKISPKWIDIIISITNPGSHLSSSVDQLNFYLVKDLESNGTLPLVSGSAQSIFTSPNPVKATVNTSTTDRFKILKKWIMPVGMIASGNNVNVLQTRVRLGGRTDYHTAAGNQGGAGRNAYYMVFLSTLAGTSGETANYEYIIGFTDV